MDITQILIFIDEIKTFVKQTDLLVDQLKQKYQQDKDTETLQRLERAHDTLKHLNDYMING